MNRSAWSRKKNFSREYLSDRGRVSNVVENRILPPIPDEQKKIRTAKGTSIWPNKKGSRRQGERVR